MIEGALNVYVHVLGRAGSRKGGAEVTFVVADTAGDAKIVNTLEYAKAQHANNQQMQLEACIAGLYEALNDDHLKVYERVEIFTDSEYVVENHRRAMFGWPKTGWRDTTSGRPVRYVEQWKRFVKLMKIASEQRRRVNISWTSDASVGKKA